MDAAATVATANMWVTRKNNVKRSCGRHELTRRANCGFPALLLTEPENASLQKPAMLLLSILFNVRFSYFLKTDGFGHFLHVM